MSEIILVTGSGRSGTSLVMHLINKAGIRLSEQLTKPSKFNPDGAFEDVRILKAQRRLLKGLTEGYYRLRPSNWGAGEINHREYDEIRDIVKENLEEARGLKWGVKAPYASQLMPLWHQIASELNCALKVVFCTRRAESVVTSLVMHYGYSLERAEAVYFNRHLEFFADLKGDAYVVRYEEIKGSPGEILPSLFDYCGLPSEKGNAEEVLELIKPSYDRASIGQVCDIHAHVRALSEKMEEASGLVQDDSELSVWCREERNKYSKC